ncbi:MAG: hypothetical protein RL885_02910 [Planctomycetota bacterium]
MLATRLLFSWTLLLAAPPAAQPVEVDSDWSRLAREVDATWLEGSSPLSAELDRLIETDEARVREIVWRSYREAPIHEELRADFEANRVRWKEHESPYTLKEVGERPEGGWPVFIAMHGGGGVAKEVNDSQWRMMRRYYRAHPEVGGYLYLALRAPNDRWNGFYDHYVPPLIERLARQLVLFGDANPDKIFAMGYSHGGYGAFAIGMKVPDLFAAVHASAAAPTGGQGAPRNLHHTIFSAMVGEKDTAYGRKERCESFAEAIAKLKTGREDVYPVTVEVVEGVGHGGLPDRDRIVGMYPATRDPSPKTLSWELTDDILEDHFWVHVLGPKSGARIEARFQGNRLEVEAKGIPSMRIGVDSRLTDLEMPVTLVVNGGEPRTIALRPSVRVLCDWTACRGDLRLARVAEIAIELDTQ